jgi:hypothetical protein
MGIFSRFSKKNKADKTAAAKPAAAPATPAAPAAPAKPAAKPAAKKAPAKAAKPADKAYQPQCGALSAAGNQCRNSARTGSKYCGSHKGYQPPTAKNVQKKKDTVGAVKGNKDTIPGAGSKDKTADGKQAQCGAVTASGNQCRNQSRDGSKYCASHKGFKHASAASKVKKADTKPRHGGAKDTKPSTRKA